MTKVGFNTWFEKQCPTVFIVKNITRDKGGVGKTVRIFGVPIRADGNYDLISIPEVSEADIRHSLLKGTLMMKIITDEVRVIESNINLVQFDECQKEFLQNAGITEGLEPGSGGADVRYLFRDNVSLIGPKNDANKVFIVPPPDKFINGNFDDNEFRIVIDHNGRRLVQNIDYIISESGGTGTGFDTVEFISLVPNKHSKIIADYVVENPNVEV
jgi:hypothetical protein